jgi:ATP-dependent helicase/nuclease subunit A
VQESVLSKDTEMKFPHFTVLKASAGSGKTHNITRRFVQFLLSEKIPRSSLKNMLAITFSNNAAKEMKDRTLLWLKKLHFGDEEKVRDIIEITSIDPKSVSGKADLLIEEILDSFSDFQVKTIDSFMTTVFKASAIDFGYNPDFELLMSIDALMDYSFDLFMRDVRDDTAEGDIMVDVVDFLLEHKRTGEAYLWDPSAALLDEIKKIYRKLSSSGKRPEVEDYSKDLSKIKEEISERVESMEKEIETSGLKKRGNSSYKTVLPLVRDKNFAGLIGKGFANPPVSKPQKGNGRVEEAYEKIIRLWGDVEESVRRFTAIFVRSRCMSYVRAYQFFGGTIDAVKRQQGKVFIGDINLGLSEYLEGSVVPDVYFRLGETIFHFLIDEFQDTSPIQWRNLFPLIENSLSQGGSLFTVGDTKQAIYGFREADYAIMKGLEKENPFPSAVHSVSELTVNFRSKKEILRFNEKVFKEKLAHNADYSVAGERSGLTEYIQKPKEAEGDSGHAEVTLLERNDDELPEKIKIQGLLRGLFDRSCDYRDIAVLTQTNEDAVRVTEWLNEEEVPFISYSSLDVRRRKVTGEIVALMNFLDSPTDDLSFGTFILGDIFIMSAEHDGIDIGKLREFCFARLETRPLYKAFQETFGDLWGKYFERLFRSAGFLPVYDLVTEIMALFRVFENLPEEESTLVKILEVAKEFEGGGFNSLKDFLATALDDEGGEKWEMAVPTGANAVRVMTIHKAKGLGFPVVIVLLYEVRNRGFEYILEEKENRVCLLKVNRQGAQCDETLQYLYDQERLKEMVNRLNSLYVGFTRAERELYVVGVMSRDTVYPFVLLPSKDFPPSAVARRPVERESAPSAAPPSCSLLHRSRQFEFPPGTEEFITLSEMRRGEFIHRVLFYIGRAEEVGRSELKEIMTKAREETGYDCPEEEIERLVASLTAGSLTAEYFKEVSGREIKREQEYTDASGRLFRMDRVVIDADAVTVVDYKTGKDKRGVDKYRTQMRNYMRILSEVYPGKPVRGIIAFVDLAEAEQMG